MGRCIFFVFCHATVTIGLTISLPAPYPGMSGIDTQSSANLAIRIDGGSDDS